MTNSCLPLLISTEPVRKPPAVASVPTVPAVFEEAREEERVRTTPEGAMTTPLKRGTPLEGLEASWNRVDEPTSDMKQPKKYRRPSSPPAPA